MRAVLTFENVSKVFSRHLERPRSFMEILTDWTRRRKGEAHVFEVVHDVSFAVEPGEALGIVGDNGAGKSTVLKLAARIVEPTRGQVTVQGQVGALLEVGVGFHPDLTGRENIYLNGAIIGLSRELMRQRFEEIVAFSGVGNFIDMPVRHYSSGMLVRLGFSVATAVNPDILLVDEVLSVGDQNFRQKCLQRIASLQESGTAILYVSHNLNEVRRVCDQALWIGEGVVQVEGQPDEVVRAYLDYTQRARGIKFHDLGDWENRGERLGSGELEIMDCVLMDEEGQVRKEFTYGEPLIIRIDYSCREPLDAAIFGISIYSDEGVRVTSPDSPPIQRLSLPGEPGSVYLRFDELRLRSGKYDLTVAAQPPETPDYRPYDHYYRAYTFKVVGPSPEGLVELPYRWTTDDE